MVKRAIVLAMVAGLAGCNMNQTQVEADVIRWHELQREIATINARMKALCEAKKDTYGLDTIGDPACIAPPVAQPEKK